MVKDFTSTLKPQPQPELKANITNFLANSFLQHFALLTDPRIERTKDHLLIDIVAIAILAIISGAEGWVGIETYGQAKYEWLKEFLELPNGIPSHDTFGRVFSRINPAEFHQGFLNWVNSITEKIEAEIISIDGKTLKQSYERKSAQKALHIVSAWSSSHQLVLGQRKVDKKSNEIRAIPALLEMLEIEGSIITIDAMGCQKEITSLIVKKKAAYVLALKGNQKRLYQEVKARFDLAKKEDFIGREYSYYKEIYSGHHRLEKREVWTVSLADIPSLYNQSLWTGLSTIIMVVSERKMWNKTTNETRFYLSSLESNAEKIAKVIRSHWGIENSLHWTLDVTFSEDNSRIRRDNAPENLALLRRLALNLLKQETTFKGSVKMKRYRAAMDNDYLTKILTSASH